MFKILKLGIIKKGIVTKKYPQDPYVPYEKTKGLVCVDRSKCHLHTECVRSCPTNAIEVRDKEIIVDIGRCVFCGECQRICPSHAITLSGEVELASKNKKNFREGSI